MPLTASVDPDTRNDANITESNKVIANGAVLYYGALVGVDANNQLVNCADSTVIRFEGMFKPKPIEYSSFPVTGDGTKRGRCVSNFEVLLPAAGTVDAADMQKEAYAADEASVTDVTTLGPQCGVFIEMGTAANTCWVGLGRAFMKLGT